MLVGKCDFYGVEILTLYVLHEGHLHDVLVVDGAYVGRYGLEPGHLRGTPTSFTCDDLESVLCSLAERDGLYDAYLAYAVGQLLQLVVIEEAARLVGVRLYLVERYLVDGR